MPAVDAVIVAAIVAAFVTFAECSRGSSIKRGICRLFGRPESPSESGRKLARKPRGASQAFLICAGGVRLADNAGVKDRCRNRCHSACARWYAHGTSPARHW